MTTTRKLWIASLAAVAIAAGARRGDAQIPQTFKNLQVLPKDISRQELTQRMRGMTRALGVRCTHCHVGPDDLEGMDFATDEKPAKVAARAMLKMVMEMNANYVSKLPPAADGTARQTVTCATCHRGQQKPPAFVPPGRGGN